jgi:hypothetical protein
MLNLSIKITGFLFLLALFYRVNGSKTILIYDFQNNTGQSRWDRACDSIPECLAREFKPYHIQVQIKDSIIKQPEQAPASSDEETIIFGYLHEENGRIKIRGYFKMDVEQTLFKKEIEYKSNESAEENVRSLALKIIYAYEKKHLANLQIFTDPEGAEIFIGSDSVGKSPWEALFPKGHHTMLIQMNGCLPAIKEFVVGKGENKFTFVLSPEAAGPDTVIKEVVVHDPAAGKSRKSRISLYTAIGFAVLAGASQILYNYYGSSDYYMKKTNDQEFLDKQYTKRNLLLYTRNASIISSTGFLMNYLFPIKKIFFRDKKTG